MYSPNSPVLSAIEHSLAASGCYSTASAASSPRAYHNSHHHHHNNNNSNHNFRTSQQQSTQCLRFKYFATFLICTTCLALLAASLATHKWLVSRPVRVLKLGSSNLTALMLTAAQDAERTARQSSQRRSHSDRHHHQQQVAPSPSALQDLLLAPSSGSAAMSTGPSSSQANNKFQGEFYFGLFNGVKVLNYGFGDRRVTISVLQSYLASGEPNEQQERQQPKQQVYELINFKFWLATLAGVLLAILFALIGSIFAIINFVMTPRGALAGPLGLVVWNGAACASCSLALVAWLVEYFLRLRSNVLSPEEVQNGWTSENRSQLGYSYHLVLAAFLLHLANISIVSLVQFETWTSQKAAKRQSRAACEGVIMLY